jgi:inositol-hexakisphosphate kinase
VSQDQSNLPSSEQETSDVVTTAIPASSSFEEAAGRNPLTTDNAEGRAAHEISPSLLEEIRNHHIILGPSNTKTASDKPPPSEPFEKVSPSLFPSFL